METLTVLKHDLDIISGEKHVERVVLKFNDLLSDCDLHDTWRLFHPEGKEYTWCKGNPFVARRLDYILTNSMCFDKTIECNIHSVASTDLRGCSVLVKFAEIERGPGYWKFNNSLLKDSIFVNQMNAVIDNHTAGLDSKSDNQLEWKFLKMKI